MLIEDASDESRQKLMTSSAVRKSLPPITRPAHDDFVLSGTDLNDLAVLAVRLNYSFKDGDEMRDWQNRLNLMIANADRHHDRIEHDKDQAEEDRRDAANDAYLAERDEL